MICKSRVTMHFVGTKLYFLVTEGHRCEQLAHSTARRPGIELTTTESVTVTYQLMGYEASS